MRTLVVATIALALAGTLAQPQSAACLSLQPDMPTGMFGEESGSYLGIDTRDITHDRMVALKLKEERGVEVTMVDQDAPAGKAGIREQDVILTFNGQPVEGQEELRRMIRETPPGRTVSLGVSREGQMITVKAQLASRRKMFQYPAMAVMAGPNPPGVPGNFEMPAMPSFDVPAIDVIVHSSVRGGLMVENLTPQLGDFFGVKNGQGVLVRSVEKGSSAERAGFRAGDVIVRVGDRPVSDTSDWRNAMRQHATGSVAIGVVRDRKSLTINFAVPRQTGQAITVEPDVVAHVDMSGLQAEMDKMRPEIERAQRQAMEAQKEFWKNHAQMRKQVEQAVQQAQRQVQAHQHEIQEQAQKAADKARRQMELHRKDIEKIQKQMEQWKHKAEEM
ncbi:MAG TPA: PDZ domain-containing protein [Terriglobales bacterium]|nr:PDZ domain-containing protein [Terriglobales bacterium]